MNRNHFLWRERCRRWARAWRYATGRSTEEDGQIMKREAETLSGWHTLNSVCVEDVLDQALRLYEDGPDLRRLVGSATEFVAAEWDDGGVADREAENAALRKVRQWAMEDGIELVLTEEGREQLEPAL